MAIATWELHRTDRPVGRGDGLVPPRPLSRRTGAGSSAAAARRPAPRAGRRAATCRGTGAGGRRLVGLALLVVAVVAVALVLPGRASADATTGTVPAAAAPARGGPLLVVGPGETVWGLVAPHAPAGADVPMFVAEVLAANGLDALAVQPGTVVRLP
jgi:hypothetical protein